MSLAVLIQGTETRPLYSPLLMDKLIAKAKYSIYRLKSLDKKFECALKIFPKDKESYIAFCREAKLLSYLGHENIIQFIPNIRFNSQACDCYFLPMEFAPYGDFFDLILSQELGDEKLIRTYFQQLIGAVEYLHSKGIAHLDLKLENLLIGEDYSLKVADFDQSQLIEEKSLRYRGSPSTRAPEVISRECKDFAAADMYSIGVILFALATGDFPFLEKENETGVKLAHYDLFCDNNEAFWDLRVGQRQEKGIFKEAFKELVSGLLEKDPKKRLNIEEVKKSRWYQGETLCEKELQKMMKLRITEKECEKEGEESW